VTNPNYQLTVQSGPNQGKTYILDKDELKIGRSTLTDIMIEDMEVSREHARLSIQAGGYVIEDLGSTNGTYVDGQRLIGPHLLRDGETIGLGENIRLVYEPAIDLDATVVPPPTVPSAARTTPAGQDVPQAKQPIPTYQPTQKAAYPPSGPPQSQEPPPGPQPEYQARQAAPPPEYEEVFEEQAPLISWRWVAAGFGCLTIIVCVLLVAALFWIDAGGEARWCQYLGFLFPACP